MHHTHSSQFFEGSINVSNSQPVKARCRAQICTVEYQIDQGFLFLSLEGLLESQIALSLLWSTLVWDIGKDRHQMKEMFRSISCVDSGSFKN